MSHERRAAVDAWVCDWIMSGCMAVWDRFSAAEQTRLIVASKQGPDELLRVLRSIGWPVGRKRDGT